MINIMQNSVCFRASGLHHQYNNRISVGDRSGKRETFLSVLLSYFSIVEAYFHVLELSIEKKSGYS